jgi:poly-gamma-glutamate capsule biosynthesis protein CapA/YwtB (metallophosphatase superfamily)
VNDVRIGLLAFADDWYQAEGTAPFPSPDPHDPEHVTRRIRTLKAKVDLVVVQLHWGYEWMMYPLQSLRDQSRAYVDAGAGLVVCHHAHVPMGIERWGTGVIAHGLGNLYFGGHRPGVHPFRNRSILLRVEVSGRSVVAAEPIPIHTTPDGRVQVSNGRFADTTLRCISFLFKAAGSGSLPRAG